MNDNHGGPAAITAENPDIADEKACSACVHAWSAHDPIGRRFCSATITMALTRGCVCR